MAKHGDILIDNIDREKFAGDIEIVKRDKEYLQEISDKLTSELTSHLDKTMQSTYLLIKDDKLDDKELERKFLEITNLIYFLGDKMESLGIELTVASARNQEVFNKLYQEAEGTIKDKQSIAEENSKYEYLLKAVYESVYKRIKLKMESAYEMVSTLKRTLMARMAAKDLSSRASGARTSAAYEER